MVGHLFHFRRRLLTWYRRHHRKLPWRICGNRSRPNPYHVLVSELMLQQTQVATVVPYFERWIARWPTLADLAKADEQQVLRLWQGLGYYARARNLLATAKFVANDCTGTLPQTVEELMRLPGIGRYTAGAIASIAFGQRAPILDGNVRRVLCRIDCIRADPRRPEVEAKLWQRAEELLPQTCVGDFNSALMELGATICTPRAPNCAACPVQAQCEARAAGMQERIPPSAAAKIRPIERRWTICISRPGARSPGARLSPAASNSGRGRPRSQEWLIERRPASGRWASMWQFVTVPAEDGAPTAKWIEERLGLGVAKVRRIGVVSHGLTHRQYEFEVFVCEWRGGRTRGRRWVALDQLAEYPLPHPHLRIAHMLAL